MNALRKLVNDEQENQVSIKVDWSLQYLIPGEENNGNLQIASTVPEETIPLKNGEKIVFMDLPSDWEVKSRDMSLWKVSTFNCHGQQKKCLVYIGTQVIKMNTINVLYSEFIENSSSDNVEIPISFDVPKHVQNVLTTKIQLFDSAGHYISDQASLLFNFISPENPLVSFSDSPASVLLSGSKEVSFPNSFSCQLKNQKKTSIPNASVEIRIKAQNKESQPIDISQNLKGVIIQGGTTWEYDDENQTWHGDLTNIVGETKLRASNLVLEETTIDLIELEFTISKINKSPYKSSAWFMAYGPYTLALELAKEVSNAKFYKMSDDGKGHYLIDPLNPNLNTPPLQPKLLDSNGKVAYPPISGWFSWDKKKPSFSSGHVLDKGDNPFYYLIKSDISTFSSLTTASVDYNFYPHEIYAKDYQQSFGEDTKNPKFGSVMPKGAIIMWNGTSIPNGWAVCDGSNGTPKLTDKFVVGAGDQSKGAKYRVATGGGPDKHSHAISEQKNITTTENGEHSHKMPKGWYSRNYSSGDKTRTGVDTDRTVVQNVRTQEEGKHNHTITIQEHSTKDNNGEIRPSWYAIYYLMKL